MEGYPSIRYELIQKNHLAGILDLCKAEDWPSYTEDSEKSWRVLTAPGVWTVVALKGEEVVGFIEMQSDGIIQAHISAIMVTPSYRGRGIGTRLVKEAFRRCGAKRVDIITDSADEFYRSFKHQCWSGYRIYPDLEP